MRGGSPGSLRRARRCCRSSATGRRTVGSSPRDRCESRPCLHLRSDRKPIPLLQFTSPRWSFGLFPRGLSSDGRAREAELSDLLARLQAAASAAIENERPGLEHPVGRVVGLTIELVIDSAGWVCKSVAYVERRTAGGASLARHTG